MKVAMAGSSPPAQQGWWLVLVAAIMAATVAVVSVPTCAAFAPLSSMKQQQQHPHRPLLLQRRAAVLPSFQLFFPSSLSSHTVRNMAENGSADDPSTDDDTSKSTTTTTASTSTIRTIPDGERAAFAFTDTTSSSDSPLSSFSLDNVSELLNRIDLSSFNFDTIRQNVMEGELGTRGEVYFAIQAFLILCILIGGVPIVGDTLNVFLGPGLLLAGITVLVLGTLDLGDALSPWTVPTRKSSTGLKTSGIYAQLRHPMYAGILAAAAGLSIVTGSANRLLLTAALWYALDIKSNLEEQALLEKFGNGEYEQYQTDVPGKFVPSALLSALPWNNKKNKGGEGGEEEKVQGGNEE